METRGGILSGAAERILAWVGFALLVFAGYSIYQIPAETKQAIWDGIWLTVFWFVIVAAVPWSGQLFIKRILEIGENWVGLVMIAAFVLVDVIAGWFMLTGWPTSGWGWAALLAALALATTYNYLVSQYLAEMAGD